MGLAVRCEEYGSEFILANHATWRMGSRSIERNESSLILATG
jgi:hypothetical protein